MQSTEALWEQFSKRQNREPVQAQRLRWRFERGPFVTTIAPNPIDGRTLKEMGWRFIGRNDEGEIVSERDADVQRASILRSFGHRI